MLQRIIAPFAALLLAACATAPLPQTAAAPAPRHSAGLVSAADPRAAEAGAEMLRKGGSATDAAIATMLALTVVEPQSSGIGGGGFYVRATPAGEVETIDGREKAPSAAGPDWLLDPDGQPKSFGDVVNTGLSVGVPGNIALAAEAHAQHGTLPWADLFAPAIALAREGWELTPRFVRALTASRHSAAHDEEGLALFYDSAGEPLPAGTLVTNEALAQTLERIASEGADAFYTGPAAVALAEKVAAETPRPERMSAEDVDAYEAKWRDAVCGLYRAYRICGMAPPSSGMTTVYAMLKQLEGVDLGTLGPDSPTFWHVFAESQRLAYADRERYLGDADFVPVPVAGLIDPDYLANRGALISPTSTMAKVEAGVVAGAPDYADGQEPEEGGTSHFVAVDRAGNVVSYTSTIESAFGSGIMSGGFYLNNELTDFSFVPEVDGRPVANRVEGNKRPRSSMAPTVVYDPSGKLMMAVGAAGGSTIPVQVARVLIGVLDFGLSVDEALALPVLYSPEDVVFVERGTALEAMMPQLEALGHEVATRAPGFKANAAVLGPDGWVGGADPRSDGVAVAE